MNVKIDTKEIFHVISILDTDLTANMSASFLAIIAKKQEEDAKSLILDLNHVDSIDQSFASGLKSLSAQIYAEQKSFVICKLKEAVKEKLAEWGILDDLNTTPTESEAWDIVQMEEIERELGAEFPE
jgi:anti-anti-sigma regulatory factor